jgi:iron-regulated transmembrane protein
MIRYDEQLHDWLLSTSEGFFSLRSFDSKPHKVSSPPPVSVMGQTVWQRDCYGRWLIGSFDGLYSWDRNSCTIIPYENYMTSSLRIPGTAPDGQTISGYSSDFTNKECVVSYFSGTPFANQPEELENKPISLWNLALEIHTGRIYAGALGSFLFIFMAGLLIMFVIVSGKKL